MGQNTNNWPNGQTKVAEWYKVKFPTDKWAIENFNKAVTFQDIFECLNIGANVYPLLGADDSIVRERVFDGLATLMGCNYEYIYYRWINSEKKDATMYIDMKGLKFTNK